MRVNFHIWMNYHFKLFNSAVSHQSPGSRWRTSNCDSTFSVNSHLCGLITVSLNLSGWWMDDKRLFMAFKEREKGSLCSFTSAKAGLNESHMLCTQKYLITQLKTPCKTTYHVQNRKLATFSYAAKTYCTPTGNVYLWTGPCLSKL